MYGSANILLNYVSEIGEFCLSHVRQHAPQCCLALNQWARESDMFCPKCGKENSDGVQFCSSCGANIAEPNSSSPAAATPSASSEQMTFGKSISTCMGKYVDFNGRASRPEYWWFYLFTILLSWGSLIVDNSGIVSGIVNLALLLPALSVAARRLHDTNRSGWWMLIAFTIIGLIPLIVWLASKGSGQSNEYGSPV